MWWALSCFEQRRSSVMGNPRSGSFFLGRRPRSASWRTWRASTPPSWTSAPEGLHWAVHHGNGWAGCNSHGSACTTETAGPCAMNTLGCSRPGQDIWSSFPNHQERQRLPPSELTLWRGSFFLPHPVSPPPVHLAKIYSRNKKRSPG